MWATPTDAQTSWPDAANLPAEHLDALLEAAQTACEAYAPALPSGAVPPAGWKLAVVYHARDLHQAGRRVGDSEAIGDAGFAVRVRPLSDTVKALLRPRRAVPSFGGSTTPSSTFLDGGAP